VRLAIVALVAGCSPLPPDISVQGATGQPPVDAASAGDLARVNDLAGMGDLAGVGDRADLADVPDLAASDGLPAVDLSAADLARPNLGLGAYCLSSATPPSTTDDCGAGTTCKFASGSVGLCRQDCTADSDCTQPTFTGGLAPVCEPALGSCTLSCNPAGATAGTHGCPALTTCIYFLSGTSTLVEASDCRVVGTGAEGADCTASFEVCAAGLACIIESTGSHTCHKLCKLGSSTLCKTGQSCKPAYSSSILASPVFGICS
jgi:hypothetical protein